MGIRNRPVFPGREAVAMLGSLLMRLLADLVVESATTMRRSFDSEVSRYFRDQKFRTTPPPRQGR
jgi:hypothetical protein